MGAWIPPLEPVGDLLFSQCYRKWSWIPRRCAITGTWIWGPAWLTVEYRDELAERQVGRLTMHGLRRIRINRWISNSGHTFWLLNQ